MKIEYLILADAAQVASGKLFVLGGGWDVWRSSVFPAQAMIGVGVCIIVDWSESGTANNYPLNITIADEAGVPIVPPVQAQFQVGRSPEMPSGSSQRVLFAFNAGLPIPRAGKYFINAIAGSSAKAQTSFTAIFVGKRVDLNVPGKGGSERGN